MADPIIPGGLRAQLILNGTSGLPEDRFVTTWAFGAQDGPTPTDTQIDTVSGALAVFLTAAGTGQTRSMAAYLGTHVASPATIKIYRLGDPPPRDPTTYDVPHTTGTGAMPAELALCGSFYASSNAPSRRGRIYWGPLSSSGNVFDGAATDGDARPALDFREDLLAALATLRDDVEIESTPWCVLSGTDGVLRRITNLWVDDAFDIQRRRGLAPTSRLVDPA